MHTSMNHLILEISGTGFMKLFLLLKRRLKKLLLLHIFRLAFWIQIPRQSGSQLAELATLPQ